MMRDPLLGAFVRQAVMEEIVPAVPLGEREKREYAEAVFERFCNPFLKHALLSIAINSVSKWKTRVLPSLLDFLKASNTQLFFEGAGEDCKKSLAGYKCPKAVAFWTDIPKTVVGKIIKKDVKKKFWEGKDRMIS